MHWTVSRRIAAGFAVALGLVIVVALVGVFALVQTSRALRGALTEERATLVPALRAEREMVGAIAAHLRFLADPDAGYVAARDSQLADARVLFKQLRDSARDNAARAIWEEVLADADAWVAVSDSAITAMRSGRREEALRIQNDIVVRIRERQREESNRGVQLASQEADRALADATRTAGRMELLMVLGALLALGVGIFSAFALNRAVSVPLRETSNVLASSAAEILAATTQQASGASESSAAVSETVTTVDEVVQTAEQATQRAKAVADSAQRAAEAGKTGRRAVDDSVTAMTAVNEQVGIIADSILELAEQAQAIGEIIAAVNDIAEQTNLLALNAAVEAARAGDQGRGFAVVASEVKALAEQSKAATQQVRQILGQIQRATSKAVMTTEQGGKQVSAGMKQVAEAGETIRALAEAVAEAAQAAVQIVASAGQQAAGMMQIRQAMANIQEAIQQNLASTKQAEVAARDLNRLGTRLVDLVGAGNHRSAAS